MKRLILLDLEATIIPVWDDFYPIPGNCAKIKEFNQDFKADEVGLFSWAVWNQRDKDVWNRVKEDFEIEMDLKFDHCWSIEDYIEMVRTNKGPVGMDKFDFFDFYDKEMCLFVLMNCGWLSGYDVVLFDDVVKPSVTTFENSKLTIFNIETFDPQSVDNEDWHEYSALKIEE